MTTGEGGMVVTNDSQLATRMRYLKDHGMSPERRYYHTELAFNYRMTNIQAALGLAQLEQIDTFIEKKRLIKHWYNQNLAGIPNIRLIYELPGTKNIAWLTCLLLESKCPISREKFGEELLKNGVDWRPFFIPMHQLPYMTGYKKYGKGISDCPISSLISKQGINIPSGCTLDERTIIEISQIIKEILTRNS